MGVEVAGACFHWSHPLLPSSSQKTFSLLSSCSKRRTIRSAFLGTILTSRKARRYHAITNIITSSLDCFFADDEGEEDEDQFVTRLQELANRLDQDSIKNTTEIIPDSRNLDQVARRGGIEPATEPPWPIFKPQWPDLVPASVEKKANSVEMPLSLRMIKRMKNRGLREVGETACCSVNKAFSSMVFIIRELQSFTLHMREILFFENVQGILDRVQGEMNASFVWLFQQIFSCTPTLMLSLMLLLANFSVYSMGHAAVASPPPSPITVSVDHEHRQDNRFDASITKTFSVVSGREASVGGGGGGKVRPVAGATDDGGADFRTSTSYRSIDAIPDEVLVEEDATVVAEEDEERVWNMIVEEASRMQAAWRDEALMNPETIQRLVSPVRAEVEGEDMVVYAQTEMMYHMALTQDPGNALLLCNFAQFLYVVVRDLDRAEYYFKRAVGMKPVDAEALGRYASFLWLGRKDLGAAEDTYLEAIDADPENDYHAANYANFLWSTGGEDTCYPL